MDVRSLLVAAFAWSLVSTIPCALAIRWIVRGFLRQRMAEEVLREAIARRLAAVRQAPRA